MDVAGCEDTFEKVEKTHGLAGAQRNVAGEANCKAACRADETCISFDLMSGENCWYFTDTDYTREFAADVNHYIIERCTGMSRVWFNLPIKAGVLHFNDSRINMTVSSDTATTKNDGQGIQNI